MVTLVIENVDKALLVKQIKSMYDLAFHERKKAMIKDQPARIETAANLDAMMDMLSDAKVVD